MRTTINNIFKLSLLLLLVGCAGTGPQSVSSGKYSEDLSVWRLPEDSVKEQVHNPANDQNLVVDKTVYVSSKISDNNRLYPVLDSIDQLNLAQKYVDGYAIQLYLGIDREEAFNTKRQFALNLPLMSADLKYTQPNYQVKSGRYYNRLEAQRDFLTIHRFFPSAIIIPDKILIHE